MHVSGFVWAKARSTNFCGVSGPIRGSPAWCRRPRARPRARTARPRKSPLSIGSESLKEPRQRRRRANTSGKRDPDTAGQGANYGGFEASCWYFSASSQRRSIFRTSAAVFRRNSGWDRTVYPHWPGISGPRRNATAVPSNYGILYTFPPPTRDNRGYRV